MTNYLKKIVDRAETRKGAGTYTLDCGHQIAVAGDDWSATKFLGVYARRMFACHECERNDIHAQSQKP